MNQIKSLIVDDDFVSRTKMSAILGKFGVCQSCHSGQAALEAFVDATNNNKPFQLITLDINMPGMDGKVVLSQIRAMEESRRTPASEQAKILMVTSISDRKMVIKTISAGCNDYLLKPFGARDVITKLEQLSLIKPQGKFEKEHETVQLAEPDDLPSVDAYSAMPQISLSEAVKQTLADLKKGQINLPPQPGIYMELSAMIAQEEPVRQIAQLLKKDLVITGKLIQIANSSYFRGLKDCQNLLEALSRLGMQVTKRQVSALCLRPVYLRAEKDEPHFKDLAANLWKHSLCCGFLSEYFAEKLALRCRLDPFTSGLMADVGKVILLEIVEGLIKRGRFSPPPNEAEIIVTLSQHHGLFGASLLNNWRFHQGYQEIAYYQGGDYGGSIAKHESLLVGFASEVATAIINDNIEASLDPLCQGEFGSLVQLSKGNLKLMISEISEKLPELLKAFN